MKKAFIFSAIALLLIGCSDDSSSSSSTSGGGGPPGPPSSSSTGSGSTSSGGTGSGQFQLDAWADNWFSMYVGETLVAEDSVSITTERSFNKETVSFDADYPLELNFIIKDYKENDSGLEYIGESNQQMGDGGFIAQITDTTAGKVVGVTSSAFKCLVIHKAPLNTECEDDSDPTSTCEYESQDEPTDWKSSTYDTSSWEAATEYSETEVGPKDGYEEVTWDSSAKLIWTSSLTQDNTLLCKYTITGS